MLLQDKTDLFSIMYEAAHLLYSCHKVMLNFTDSSMSDLYYPLGSCVLLDLLLYTAMDTRVADRSMS